MKSMNYPQFFVHQKITKSKNHWQIKQSIFDTRVLFKDTKGYNLFQIDAH